jgi:hypothetical protein
VATPAAARGVERAIKDTRAQDRITLLRLQQAATLWATELREVRHARA